MSQFDTENKDVLLAMALAAGASASDAARQLEVSISTVKRRLADPDFRRFVADLRAEMLARALGRVTDNMTRAADTLAGLLDDQNPAIRIRAARALLTLGLRLHDAIDVTERVRAIEEELERRREDCA
jgi:transposase-like protein